MSDNSYPLVSIGLPVYNAGERIASVLDALTGQDYPNIEIIISDNASTDSTWRICEEYAARDERIKLFRHEKNHGGIHNFNHVFGLATGKYFMWAAHDDHWQPTFISQCVEQLEANPEAVMCFVHYRTHHLDTDTYLDFPHDLTALRDRTAWRRIEALLKCDPFPYPFIYSVFRREALAQVMPIQITLGSDGILLFELASMDPFVSVGEPLFIIEDGSRSLKGRMRAIGVPVSGFTLLQWDWTLFWRVLKATQRAASGWRVRWRLLKAFMIFYYRQTGWPSPKRIFDRYSYFIFPEALVQRWVAWYRQLKQRFQ